MEGSANTVRVQLILAPGISVVPDEVQDVMQRHGARLQPVRTGAGLDERRYRGVLVPANVAASFVDELLAQPGVDGAYVKPLDEPA